MGREEAVETLDARVEALHEELELVRLGGGAGLVDLDPRRAEVDQGLEIRPDHVAGELEREVAARRDLALPPHRASEAAVASTVVLVVGPDGERVRTGDRDLEVVLGGRLQELELVVVVRGA